VLLEGFEQFTTALQTKVAATSRRLRRSPRRTSTRFAALSGDRPRVGRHNARVPRHCFSPEQATARCRWCGASSRICCSAAAS
jgi:hypothetical protein